MSPLLSPLNSWLSRPPGGAGVSDAMEMLLSVLSHYELPHLPQPPPHHPAPAGMKRLSGSIVLMLTVTAPPVLDRATLGLLD